MKTNDLKTLQRLALIAQGGLHIAGIIFICLALFEYETTWTLPAALGCNSLGLILLAYNLNTKSTTC